MRTQIASDRNVEFVPNQDAVNTFRKHDGDQYLDLCEKLIGVPVRVIKSGARTNQSI